MHDGPVLGAALDDAGHADADAEQPLGGDVRGVEHLGDAVADVADDALDLVPALLQGAFGAGEFGEREVEQLDTHARLADVHADHVAAGGRDAQQGAGAAAVGVDAAGLLHEPVGDQVGDDIADRAGAEAGDGAQLEAAEGAVEVEPLQDGRAVGPPEIAYRTPVALRHVGPLRTLPDLQHTCAGRVRATFVKPLVHDVS